MTANIAIKLTGVSDKGTPWGVVPVEDSLPNQSDYQANPASSTVSSIVVPAAKANPNIQYYWVLTALGGDAWAAFGTAPVATIGGATCQPLPQGLPRAFRAIPGHKVAVINGA